MPVDGPGLVPARTPDARTPHHVPSVQSRRQNRLEGRNMLRDQRGKANLCVILTGRRILANHTYGFGDILETENRDAANISG